ncbi:LptF/LptG family permease [Halanaerobacter jeridensis]|uniref:Lipopolysaccharide export system permease protein n=1 Tax=Halanaerobacter jeridensis TaxID=706427 RepID=A0A938XPH2_9FIRM|nr:LptF/LptG family permease [Halanaerobacter jeridensis]MBM7556963.1 lipopolysaccharide export system permease protein [Halanaerobacter jeridensis]
MKIVYRYILKELIQPFLFGVFAFTSIFVGSDVLISLAKLMMEYGLPIITTVKLFFLSLPQIVVWTFPMSMLLASLLAFGRLSGDSEITALKAGGVSFMRLVIPVLVVALLISGLTIWLNDTLVPKSTNLYEEIVWKMKHGETKPKTQQNLRIAPVDSATGKLDFVLTASKFDGETQTLNEVTLQNYEDGKLVNIIQAEKAKWLDSKWVFMNGVSYTITKEGRVPQTKFTKMNMKNRLNRDPEQISRRQKEPEEMSLKELGKHIELLEQEGQNVKKLKVTYHQRYSIPFACFIFALVGAPLGLQPNRSGSSIGLGLSIIVIFIYYTMMTVGSALGQSGNLTPWLGAWLQNIIFMIVGIGLLYKTQRF